MNIQTLNYIARKNEPLETQEVIDLIQLCEQFPYFSLPFVLLSKHYKQKNDYRANDLLFQAALRVHDRNWLQQQILQAKILQNEELKPSTNAVEPEYSELEITVDKESTSTVIEPPTNENIPENTEYSEETIEETEAISDEIQINSTIENQEYPSVEDNIDLQTDELQDIQTIETDFNIEPETHYSLPEIDQSSSKHSSYSEFESMFNREIENSLFIPGSNFEPVIVSNSEQTDSGLFQPANDEDEKMKISTSVIQPRGLSFSAGYNIEDYFPTPTEALKSDNVNAENKDFFSWLNASTSVAGPENKATADKLIDNFIRTKPSISKPKQEFYSPEKAMKRSEILSRELATETLAKIYLQQERPEKALEIYEQLKLKFPEKMPYFASLIEKIKIEHNI